MYSKIKYVIAAALISTSAAAHELTPTYFDFRPSFVNNVLVTTLKMWNRRNDVLYYEISVFDKDLNKVPFATSDKIIKIEYLEHKTIDVFIREKDKDTVTFICTTSKQLKEDVKSTGIQSMICSKIK